MYATGRFFRRVADGDGDAAARCVPRQDRDGWLARRRRARFSGDDAPLEIALVTSRQPLRGCAKASQPRKPRRDPGFDAPFGAKPVNYGRPRTPLKDPERSTIPLTPQGFLCRELVQQQNGYRSPRRRGAATSCLVDGSVEAASLERCSWASRGPGRDRGGSSWRPSNQRSMGKLAAAAAPKTPLV